VPSTPFSPKEEPSAVTEPSAESKENSQAKEAGEQNPSGRRPTPMFQSPVFDALPEAALDRLTRLAARLLQVPLAAVSLADQNKFRLRAWGEMCRGSLPAEVSREGSPCAAALLSGEVLVVEDARLDPRFQDHLLVSGFDLRFYAGVPLILADGAAAGTLCVMDCKPRPFSQDQQATLTDLAAIVATEIELHRAQAISEERERMHRQMFADNPHPMWVFDAETLRFLDVNDAALAVHGYSRAEFLSLSLYDIRPAEDHISLDAHFQQPVAPGAGNGTRGIWRHQTKHGKRLWMEIVAYGVRFEGRNARMIVAHNVTKRQEAAEALRRSEQKLSLHVQLSPLAVIEMTPEGLLTAWNPSAETTFGYTAAEALGQNVISLIVPEEGRGAVAELGHQMRTRQSDTRSTNHNRTKSGKTILCEWHNTPLIDEDGQVVGIASMARDITQEAAAQERLRRSEAHKAAILDSAIDCIILIDQQGRIVDWNAAAERTFGCSCAEARGQAITDLILPPALRSSYQDGLLHYLENGNWPAFHTRVELPALRRDGTEFQAELTATALQADGEALYTLYLRDVSERKLMESEREELLTQTEFLLADALERADHDSLSGLLNHRAFHKKLKEDMDAAREGGRRGAVLLVDLNNFKYFNDAYGHLAGDDVLRQISLSFAAACRAEDTLARFGGDEFALLLPGAFEADALAAAEKLREAALLVGYHPPGYETPIPFSLSVGIACFPGDGISQTVLLEVADARLQVSKSGGDADSPALTLRRNLARSVGGFTMLDALVTAVDNKDRYTRRHSEDVMHYSLQIASALGLDAETRRVIEIAALLHDVGKIGVPDAILRKPGRLSEGDYEAIKQHPLMGSIIVGAVPGFEETLDAVRHHHERWDGGGYPFGLAAEETPLTARLMAVADAYSAMTTDRPYRKGMDPQKARDILQNGAGTQWDPACVRAFLEARVSRRVLPGTTRTMNDEQPNTAAGDIKDDNDHIDSEAMNNDAMDTLPDGDRQLTTGSAALDEGGTNDSDLGADVAGDIGPKHP